MLLTMNQVIPMLPINKHGLDDELEKQAQTAFNISQNVARSSFELREVDDRLEKYEAELYITLRRESSDQSRKMTVEEIKCAIQEDHRRGELQASASAYRRVHEEWLGLSEAWKQRGFALKSLADLAVANYYEVDTTYENNRKVIAESRQSRQPVRRQRRSVNDN